MTDFIKVNIARLFFWGGFYWFRFFGYTPKYSYLSLRKLFYTSNGNFNMKVSKRLAKNQPTYTIAGLNNSILGRLSPESVNDIAASIQRDGFYKFDTLLDPAIINDLTEFSLRTKAELMPKVAGHNKFDFFNIDKPLTIKYEYHEGDLVQNKNIQRLISDAGIISVAQAFLGTRPILDMIAMWWSTPSKRASSEVAQLYHWDMERIKFLKIFFYLTEVTENTGPHCYIKGSNNGFPEAVRKDGRISDEEIKTNYPKENILEITGAKGTILAVDTSGFHKGKNLSERNRLLLQFEFANSLFGVKNNYFKVTSADDQFASAREKYPHVFQRYS
jgi:hypothetical protein